MAVKGLKKNKVDNGVVGKINVFGVKVADISCRNAVLEVLKLAKPKSRGKYVVTVNSEFVMKARRDTDFAQILANADLALADGWWVAFLRLISGGKEHDRLTGVDLIEMVCNKAADKAITVGFLGGFGSVAKDVAKRQKMRLASLKVVMAEPGDPSKEADLRLKQRFLEIGRVDVLFVAYGMGKQEFWIDRMRKSLDVGVFIGVGGAFDYLSGIKRRAPRILQNLGFEWLWRLFWQPSRIWRQRIIPVFFLMILGKIIKVKIFDKIFKK
ncbi:MAG: WecB/TagA/CpsF family glycosyltransferase [Candidatus Magasanikbacteria bacterium]|nr:WecB/TagA/CpsF family glycosyltransferase [Candidatus Magasanikbacteria bacterium]